LKSVGCGGRELGSFWVHGWRVLVLFFFSWAWAWAFPEFVAGGYAIALRGRWGRGLYC